MIATPSIFIVSLRQLFASSATATSLRSLPQSATRTKRNVKRSVRILVRFPRIRMKGRPVRDAVPSISSDWTGPSYVPAIMHFLSISLFTLLSESQIRIQTPKPRDGENEGKRRLYPAFHLYLHPECRPPIGTFKQPWARRWAGCRGRPSPRGPREYGGCWSVYVRSYSIWDTAHADDSSFGRSYVDLSCSTEQS